MTLLRIASFELRRRLRMISTYVYFTIFLAIGALWTFIAAGGIPHASVDVGAGGKVYANAPLSLLFLMMVGTLFGTIVTAAIAGRATFQDVDHRTTALFFTTPISKLDYLGGRFLGAFASAFLVFPGVALGAWAAVHCPWVDATRVGPEGIMTYVAPYLTLLAPDLVFTAALFFALATVVKRMLPVYVGGVVLVLGYLIATNLTGNIEHRTLAALLDPFGTNAIEYVTEYWTIAEKNRRVVPLEGVFLYNRLIWMSVGLAALAFAYRRFSFAEAQRGGAAAPREPEEADVVAVLPVRPRAPALDFSPSASFGALLALTRLQLKETVKNVFFLVIVLAGILFVFSAGGEVGEMFGTKTYPVTYEVLEVLGGMFSLFLLIIIAFYSGELVWRERDVGLAQIFDGLPVPRWVVFTAKLLALIAVQVVLLGVLFLACVGLQAAKGYFRFELGLYAETLLGVRLPALCFLCCLAMFVHVVVNNKYVGHFVMILYFVAAIAMPLMGLERRVYRLGSLPDSTYSAMNGFGHFVTPLVTFQTYWGVLAVGLALGANALWVRGLETTWGKRLAIARSTFTRPMSLAFGVALAAFAGLAGFILWNTDHLNTFKPRLAREEEQAYAEKTYKRWTDVPKPMIESVSVAADIYPETRRLDFRGTYALENESDADIPQVLVSLPSFAHIRALSFGRGEKRSVSDERVGVYVYDFPAPLRPHEKATLTFDVGYTNEGFPDSGARHEVVSNGSFANSFYAPHLGYQSDAEIEDDATRHKHGLAPKKIAPAGDPIASRRQFFGMDANWVDFDATVSTTEGQLAIAPGYLQREWSEGGRHYFHYAMDSKMLDFYSFLSARYAVLKDSWSPPASAMPGSRDVAIEIDYQPEHTYDLARMVKGIKLSLDYFTTKFGPYQHRQARIVEFPRYERFAQSFPNTIPYSEAIGFIARVDDKEPDDIDYPFYVTAHEIAHQWWAHQVISGDVEGATMLDETMAQYSALMVMKHEYGPDKMKKFLRYELDRYLHGRSTAKRAETPLVRVGNEPYIHYGKGSVAMYALQDYIGEDALDASLARYVAKTRFQPPPYTDARELVAAFREAAPPEYQYVIEDLFETITLFENRAMHATSHKRADGRYDVSVDVRARKLRAGEDGAEKEVPLHDFIDVGVLGKDGAVLANERKRFDAAEATYTFVVDAEPVKAGIDPINKLIDRQPDDNVVAVERD